jgi:hypothetical protein
VKSLTDVSEQGIKDALANLQARSPEKDSRGHNARSIAPGAGDSMGTDLEPPGRSQSNERGRTAMPVEKHIAGRGAARNLPRIIATAAPQHSVAAAAEFLRHALASSALGVPELEVKARKVGLLREGQPITHAKVFKRAKKLLGVKSSRHGFGSSGEWVWQLDERPAPSSATGAIELGSVAVAADAPPEANVEASAEDEAVKVTSASRVPVDWKEGLAALDYHRPAFDIPPHRWRQFMDDCSAFLTKPEGWAERAARLGWGEIELFGCHRHRPLDHLGSAGLLWVINGGRLIEIHRDWAVFELAVNGSRRVFDRRRLKAANVTVPWVEPGRLSNDVPQGNRKGVP